MGRSHVGRLLVYFHGETIHGSGDSWRILGGNLWGIKDQRGGSWRSYWFGCFGRPDLGWVAWRHDRETEGAFSDTMIVFPKHQALPILVAGWPSICHIGRQI